MGHLKWPTTHPLSALSYMQIQFPPTAMKALYLGPVSDEFHCSADCRHRLEARIAQLHPGMRVGFQTKGGLCSHSVDLLRSPLSIGLTLASCNEQLWRQNLALLSFTETRLFAYISLKYCFRPSTIVRHQKPLRCHCKSAHCQSVLNYCSNKKHAIKIFLALLKNLLLIDRFSSKSGRANFNL